MATNISEWVQHISARVPLCPDPVIEQEVLFTCQDFCQRTLLWDENKLDPINIVATTHTYALSSTDGDICAVDLVRVDSVPITPVSVNELNKRGVTWRDLTSSRPAEYIVGMKDEIRLVYIPTENITAGLEVWVCLKPLKTATSVEDFLYRDYRDVIKDGASGRLLEIPGQPWSDIELANYFITKYEDARDSAMSKKFTGRTRMQITATPVYFA